MPPVDIQAPLPNARKLAEAFAAQENPHVLAKEKAKRFESLYKNAFQTRVPALSNYNETTEIIRNLLAELIKLHQTLNISLEQQCQHLLARFLDYKHESQLAHQIEDNIQPLPTGELGEYYFTMTDDPESPDASESKADRQVTETLGTLATKYDPLSSTNDTNIPLDYVETRALSLAAKNAYDAAQEKFLRNQTDLTFLQDCQDSLDDFTIYYFLSSIKHPFLASLGAVVLASLSLEVMEKIEYREYLQQNIELFATRLPNAEVYKQFILDVMPSLKKIEEVCDNQQLEGNHLSQLLLARDSILKILTEIQTVSPYPDTTQFIKYVSKVKNQWLNDKIPLFYPILMRIYTDITTNENIKLLENKVHQAEKKRFHNRIYVTIGTLCVFAASAVLFKFGGDYNNKINEFSGFYSTASYNTYTGLALAFIFSGIFLLAATFITIFRLSYFPTRITYPQAQLQTIYHMIHIIYIFSEKMLPESLHAEQTKQNLKSAEVNSFFHKNHSDSSFSEIVSNELRSLSFLLKILNMLNKVIKILNTKTTVENLPNLLNFIITLAELEQQNPPAPQTNIQIEGEQGDISPPSEYIMPRV